MTETPEGKDPETGRFLPGNRFWEKTVDQFLANHGAEPKYTDPDELMRDCAGYFAEIAASAWFEEKVFQHDGKVIRTEIPKMRPMTIEGLCNHLGITKRSWQMWRNERSDLQHCIFIVDQVIEQQKREGAAAGFFDGRYLGFATEVHLAGGPEGAPIKILDETPLQERARQFAFYMRQALEVAQAEKEKPSDDA